MEKLYNEHIVVLWIRLPFVKHTLWIIHFQGRRRRGPQSTCPRTFKSGWHKWVLAVLSKFVGPVRQLNIRDQNCKNAFWQSKVYRSQWPAQCANMSDILDFNRFCRQDRKISRTLKSANSTFSRVRWRDVVCRWFEIWQRFIEGFYIISKWLHVFEFIHVH